jgi:DNA-binding transcriptional MerR regulator
MTLNDIVLSAEAARILGCTPTTVRALERRGVLRAVRTPSGVRLFLRGHIEALAAERAAQRDARTRVARTA